MASFSERIRSGRPQLGLCITYPAAGVVERIGPDWDWIWIDCQHGELDYRDALEMVRACDLIQRPAFVRVPAHEAGAIGKALDMGAAAVIVPQVDTPEQAYALVQAAKFSPLGNRSYGGRRPIDRLGRAYAEDANRETLLVLQIESPQAIDNADAIAAITGVDALFLGPDDIMLRRGFSMTAARSAASLSKDMDAVVRAARQHGKLSVTVGFGAEMLTACVKTGFNLIVSGGDVPFLANTSKQVSAEARALVAGATTGPAGAQSPA